MTVVTVKGLPSSISIGRFSLFLKRTILRNKKSLFLVTKSNVDFDLSEFNVQFKSDTDAEKANRMLQGFEFINKKNSYILQCYMNNDPSIPNTDAFMSHKTKNNDSDWGTVRSRSPIKESVSKDDLTEVDIAIELTRKKRVLLEEQRKLLLEQKKLELLKASSPNDIKELQVVENVKSVGAIESMLAQKRRKPIRHQTQIGGSYKVRQRIFSQMAKVFYANVTPEDSYELRKFVHRNIRERIQGLQKDDVVMSNNEVYNLYRKAYPESGDEADILSLIKDGVNQISNRNKVFDAKPKTVAKVSQNRSINELSELQNDFDMDDLDDWIDDEMKEQTNDVQMVPQEKI